MANRTKGYEPLDRPFKKRRRTGGRNAGQRHSSTAPGSMLLAVKANTVLEAAQLARQYGIPGSFVRAILRANRRNNMKMQALAKAMNEEYPKHKKRAQTQVASTPRRKIRESQEALQRYLARG